MNDVSFLACATNKLEMTDSYMATDSLKFTHLCKYYTMEHQVKCLR